MPIYCHVATQWHNFLCIFCKYLFRQTGSYPKAAIKEYNNNNNNNNNFYKRRIAWCRALLAIKKFLVIQVPSGQSHNNTVKPIAPSQCCKWLSVIIPEYTQTCRSKLVRKRKRNYLNRSRTTRSTFISQRTRRKDYTKMQQL